MDSLTSMRSSIWVCDCDAPRHSVSMCVKIVGKCVFICFHRGSEASAMSYNFKNDSNEWWKRSADIITYLNFEWKWKWKKKWEKKRRETEEEQKGELKWNVIWCFKIHFIFYYLFYSFHSLLSLSVLVMLSHSALFSFTSFV